jgi:hypothetical protein
MRPAVKIRIEINEADVALIKDALRDAHADGCNSHGPLTIQRLAAILLEDVALAVRRPGSWEGANMLRVLECHGYRF